MKDYYQILDIPPNASQEKIKEQYHFLAQKWHPDKFPDSAQKAKAEEKMKEINEANDILKNPTKRSQYDRERSGSWYDEEVRRQEKSHAEEAKRPAEQEQKQRQQAEEERQRAEYERQQKERAEQARRQRETEAAYERQSGEQASTPRYNPPPSQPFSPPQSKNSAWQNLVNWFSVSSHLTVDPMGFWNTFFISVTVTGFNLWIINSSRASSEMVFNVSGFVSQLLFYGLLFSVAPLAYLLTKNKFSIFLALWVAPILAYFVFRTTGTWDWGDS